MHLLYPLLLAALLFAVGVYGLLARRNAVLVLMSVELMLNAVNLNLVAFDAWLRDALQRAARMTAGDSHPEPRTRLTPARRRGRARR